MKEVKEYKFVMATGPTNLNEKVNKLIGEGWQPFGSAVICYGKVDTLPGTRNNEVVDGYMAAQAMVKY